MQPIVLLALVGVAAAALGTGFLGQQEPIMVNLQGLGVGTTLVSIPLSDVWVDLSVDKTEKDTMTPNGLKTIFINIVDECSFHFSEFDSKLGEFTNLGPGSEVFCKISDEDGDIVAEGWIRADDQIPTTMAFGVLYPSVTYPIPLTEFACAGGAEECTRVGWVHDVQIVVLGTFQPPD